jgi:hypothetical protein
MKRFVVILSFLTISFLFVETVSYAQRGRGAGGGGAGRGAAPPPVGQPLPRGNSAGAGANSNRPADTPQNASNDKKPQNKVADDIHLNPKLEGRVKELLPANTSLDEASAGFKNRGQFISALHVSKNLNIPFADLRARMTGSNSMSLGDSVATLRPDMSRAKANEEARRAEKEAKETEEKEKSD